MQENGTVKRIWEGFWQLADPKIWIASTVPMLLAGVIAFAETGTFSLLWVLAALAGVYFIEIGKNAINECIDYISGVDRFVEPDKRTPFSGGKKTIVDKKLTVKESAVIAVITMAAGALVGLCIVLYREFNVLWIGLAGFFFATFYSLPPLKFCYRGLGEFVVGFTFGPLILNGMYLVLTHRISIASILASIPIGILIANVLWINQFPDYEADAKGGKRNWVVRLGKKRSVKVYEVLFALAYVSIIVLAVVTRNPWWLLALLGSPIAYGAVKIAAQYYGDIPRLIAANAKTVQVYQLTGLLLAVGAILGWLV